MAKALDQWTVYPHGELTELDTGVLTVTGDIPMPLGNFPRRMTVVALNGGGTAIWSAIALDEPQMARIEALGAPSVLIVPNHQQPAGCRNLEGTLPRNQGADAAQGARGRRGSRTG